MKKLKTFAVMFVALTLVTSVGEMLARSYMSTHPWLDYKALREMRYGPYADSPYWSTEFLAAHVETGSHLTLTEHGYWQTTDYHTDWINFDGPYRRTTDQPIAYQHTVWMLGNSVLLGIETIDKYTIPSQVQRLIGSKYRVINTATRATSKRLLYIQLRDLPIQPGDIVVFLDGAETAQTVTHDLMALPTLDRALCAGLKAAVQSALINLACAHNWLPPADDRSFLQLIERYRTDFAEGSQLSRQYATSRGARFFEFLQPYIWTSLPTGYEVTQITDNPGITLHEAEFAYTQTMPALLTVEGVIDATHSLDRTRRTGQAVYIDIIHMNEVGNAALAEAIADYVIGF